MFAGWQNTFTNEVWLQPQHKGVAIKKASLGWKHLAARGVVKSVVGEYRNPTDMAQGFTEY